MATIGNAPVFPTESVLPGNLEVTGNATINGTTNSVGALTENGNAVRTVATSGAILQVVQATTTTGVTVASTTWTDTTLTASITPTSSSNKVLIMIMQEFVSTRSSSSVGIGIRLLRDTTTIWNPVASGTGPFMWYTAGGGDSTQELDGHAIINYLDSPSTTSSVTYKTQGRPHSSANSGRAIFQYNSTVNSTSTIILMEVVA